MLSCSKEKIQLTPYDYVVGNTYTDGITTVEFIDNNVVVIDGEEKEYRFTELNIDYVGPVKKLYIEDVSYYVNYSVNNESIRFNYKQNTVTFVKQ
jgi:hypothetical protein